MYAVIVGISPTLPHSPPVACRMHSHIYICSAAMRLSSNQTHAALLPHPNNSGYDAETLG